MSALLPYVSTFGIGTEIELLHSLAWLMIAMGATAFVALMFVEAPYGKYADKAQWYYGPPMDGRLAWVLQECPSFFGAAIAWYAGIHDPARRAALTTISPQTVLLSLYLFHYFNRSFIYPLRIRGGKPTPFVVFLMAFVFCVWNGYMQGRYLASFSAVADTSTAAGAVGLNGLLSLNMVAGVTLFFAGMRINWQADDILRNLRKPGDTGYRIPVGGAFELVSGANFFGEILEWTGFAIAAWSLPATAFALFTFFNIAPRGAQHHAWYLRTFKDYPRSRYAVIPFLW